MKIHAYLFTLIGGFFVGVIWASLEYQNIWLFASGLAIALLLFLPLARPQIRQWYALGAVVLFGFVAGFLRFEMTNTFSPQLERSVGEVITLEGRVATEPDERETTSRITFKPHNAAEKILLVLPRQPEYHYGDVLKVTGKLTVPENFVTEAGREFDYINYLKKDGIAYQLYQPEVSRLGYDGNVVIGSLYQIKRAYLNAVARVVAEPHASLLAGLVVGAKQGMGTELNDAFRRVGLSHIVVLSGYNLSVVANAILNVLSFLPLRLALSAGGGTIILFAIMVGGGATVIRASIMALLVIIARATGRIYDVTIALVAAGFLMVVVNPRVLVFDLGFQLSFIATAGIVYGVPLVERKLEWLTPKLGIREVAATTVAAQLAVLPWLMYKIGAVSLVALPANLLVLTVVPATMLAGFVAGVLSLWWWPLALLPGFAAQILLGYILLVTKVFAAVPLAEVEIPGVPLVLALAAYAAMIWVIRRTALNYKSEELPKPSTPEVPLPARPLAH